MAARSRIYSSVQKPPPVWQPPHASHPITVTNILQKYVEGGLRTENYDRVANTIFRSLADTLAIANVTYGNPQAYDSVAKKLVRRVREAGYASRAYLESSIDTLFCDLGQDMSPGVQVYDAPWVVVAEIRLENPHSGHLIANRRVRLQSCPLSGPAAGPAAQRLNRIPAVVLPIPLRDRTSRILGISPEHPNIRKTPLLEVSKMA